MKKLILSVLLATTALIVAPSCCCKDKKECSTKMGKNKKAHKPGDQKKEKKDWCKKCSMPQSECGCKSK